MRNVLAGSLRSPSETWRVFDSDNSDTSSPEIDISALLKSDHNSSTKHFVSDTDAKSDGLGQGPSATGEGGASNFVSQNDINQMFLSQLAALDDRLNKKEKENKHEPTKTSDRSKIKTSAKR